jgi:hypothetical protein
MRKMLSDEEVQYLIWLTETQFQGFGAIVDLGPWLGSSTAALVEGLRRCRRADFVHAFDLFEWERSYMEPIAPLDLPQGTSFLPAFWDNVGGYASQIRAERQDLTRYRWSGGDIELLFVDAAKSWTLLNAIFAGFGDALVPGKSRVILQDYRHYDTYFLPLVFEGRPDLWVEREAVVQGTTVTFAPRRAVRGPGGIADEYGEEDFTLAAAEVILRRRMARENAENGQRLLAALYRKAALDGSPEQLRALRAELGDGRPPFDTASFASVLDVSASIAARGWQQLARNDIDAALASADRTLVDDPRSYAGLSLLAACRLRRRDVQAAEGVLRQLVDTGHGANPSVLLMTSHLEMLRDRLSEAFAAARRGLDLSNGQEWIVAWAMSLLEQVWLRRHDLAIAHAEVATLLARYPQSPSVWMTAAQIDHELGDPRGHRAKLDKVLELDPTHARASEQRASLPADAL